MKLKIFVQKSVSKKQIITFRDQFRSRFEKLFLIEIIGAHSRGVRGEV